MIATRGWQEVAEMSEDARCDFEMTLFFAEELSKAEPDSEP